MEANKEINRHEERLLLSAMYELGMKIMDKNLHSNISAQVRDRSPIQVRLVYMRRVSENDKCSLVLFRSSSPERRRGDLAAEAMIYPHYRRLNLFLVLNELVDLLTLVLLVFSVRSSEPLALSSAFSRAI